MTITWWILFSVTNGKIIKEDGLRKPFIIYVFHTFCFPFNFFLLIIWATETQKYFLEPKYFSYSAAVASIFLSFQGILPIAFVFQRIQIYRETGMMHDNCAYFGAVCYIDWVLKLSLFTVVPLSVIIMFLDSDEAKTFTSVRFLTMAASLTFCKILNLYFIWIYRHASERLQVSSRNFAIEIDINLKLVSSIHTTSIIFSIVQLLMFQDSPGQIWGTLLQAAQSISNNMLMFFVLYNSEAEKAIEDNLQQNEEEMVWVEIPGCRPIKIRESVMIADNLSRFKLRRSRVLDRVRRFRARSMCREYEASFPQGELQIPTEKQVNQRMRDLLME